MKFSQTVFPIIFITISVISNNLCADTGSDSILELEPYNVDVDQGPFTPVPLVAHNAVIKGSEIASINAVNIEDTIKYLPNLNIRKRYIGDTNGVTSIRGQHTWMTGRTIVTVDGILISNFLQTRWSGSPRWAVVSPDEIDFSEVIYGPYSAFYGGNALGGSINLYTRMPRESEAVIKTSYFVQDFSLYGSADSYTGYKFFTSYGNRFGPLDVYIFYSRLENDSHPQTFQTTTSLQEADGTEPEAFGAHLDSDPRGRDRLIYSSTGPESLTHDLFKVKTRYHLSESLQAQFSIVYWKNDSAQDRVENYLEDENGDPVWNGTYRSHGQVFTVSPTQFGANQRAREDILMGFTLGGRFKNGWKFDTTVSYFNVIEDEERVSTLNPNDPQFDNQGRVTWFDDTHWLTFDFKTGVENLFGKDGIDLFAGYHYSDYSLRLNQFDTHDWNAGTHDSLSNVTGGDTRTQAVFAQADWQWGERWLLTFGLRQEWWQANHGFVEDATGMAFHPDRDSRKFSPKLSLAYDLNRYWKISANLAKAYRFPLVPELFQGRVGVDGRVDRNNPGLHPEDATAFQLSAIRSLDGGQLRLTYFRDKVENAIFNLLDSELQYSLFLNVDEVLTEGLEFVYDKRGVLTEKLDLRFNLSYTDSTIEKNSANTTYEGNRFPRIPLWRLNLLTTYRFNEKWSASLGGRYQSHAYNRLENDDHGNNYGSISRFLVFDFKTTYRHNENASLSFGIDNLNDEEYFVSHPYPQRTFFFDANFKF